MDLIYLESQLKIRWNHPYIWYRKQNNAWDKMSSFIYKSSCWDRLNENIALVIAFEKPDQKQFFQYCCNRWYNFWSAQALEYIFTKTGEVIANQNPKNRKADFNLFGKNFDLKTSIFPKAFNQPLDFAQNNPEKLITWFYENQSRQQRFHLENRIFLVVYAENGKHWKLKAEISWLKPIIENYVATFETSQLKQFQFQPGKTTFSDIIWAVK